MYVLYRVCAIIIPVYMCTRLRRIMYSVSGSACSYPKMHINLMELQILVVSVWFKVPLLHGDELSHDWPWWYVTHQSLLCVLHCR